MEEGDPSNKKEESIMENEDAEEGEILDDDDEEESSVPANQQQTSTSTPTGQTSASSATTTNAPTSTSSSTLTSSSTPTSTTSSAAFSNVSNHSDKSGPGVINCGGLSLNSGNNPSSGSSSREISSRSLSERNKKDENRSSSKKSDSKKSSNSTTGTGNSTPTTSRSNNNSDKRKRRKHGKEEDGKDSIDKDKDAGASATKDMSDENGLRPSKRRATSREPGEANETGSSEDDNSDRTDSDDDSVDFNEEFFKGMFKQMEEMLKSSGKDGGRGQRKKREKVEKMMEKLKRLQSGSDTREMREMFRQNRRLFRHSPRDRSRDRFDRFGPRGDRFRDRRGRGAGGGRMRDRMWRDRDRDRGRDFRDRDRERDRDRDRDRDRFRDRDKPMSSNDHHHHHHSSHPSSQSMSTTATSLTTSTSVTASTPSTSTTTPTTSLSSSSNPTTNATTSSSVTSSSSNPPVILQQSAKDNDKEREKSPKHTCKYTQDGKCSKGPDCPLSHDASSSSRKRDICKFYLQGFCGKGDGCLFMHGEFPCKFYHTGAECYSGEKCRFSHEPLTEETRSLLKNYLDSGELPDEVNRGPDGSSQTKPKRAAILGDPTEEMKKSWDTWLWQQEMKELELAYTGTKRNLFLIEKEFAIEKPVQPDANNPHPYYRPDTKAPDAPPKVLSYYIDTMSDPGLLQDASTSKAAPTPTLTAHTDKHLIELSFHDEDLRLPPSSGLPPPRLPPPMGPPGPASSDPTTSPFPGIHAPPPAIPMGPLPPNLTSLPPPLSFDPSQQPPPLSQPPPALTSSLPTFNISSNNHLTPSNSSSSSTLPSGPPPLLPMQSKFNSSDPPFSSTSSFPFVDNSNANNNQLSHTTSTATLNTVMSDEMPLPPLKENLPPTAVSTYSSGYQEAPHLGPPPPLYAVNSLNGPPPVNLDPRFNSSQTTSIHLSSLSVDVNQLNQHDNCSSMSPNHYQQLHYYQQPSSAPNNPFIPSQESIESASSSASSIKSEVINSIPDNLPLAARHLLQRISNSQKTGVAEDSESADLSTNEPANETSNKCDLKPPLDIVLQSANTSVDKMIKPLDGIKTEAKQLLSDSDDDTEDEPVRAALKNLKHAPVTSTPPPPIKLNDPMADKKPNKAKLDIAKMLNVIRQTTMQVVSSQPVNPSTDNKHADFWQNILSGTNLVNNSPASLGQSTNSTLDFRDSRSSSSLPGSGSPPQPGTEARDPRLKRSSNECSSLEGSSPFLDTPNKSSEPVFKSDFDYRLLPMSAPKIDYSIYESLFNSDIKMKADPRLINFFTADPKKHCTGSSSY